VLYKLAMSYIVRDLVLYVINICYELRINVNGISNLKKVMRLEFIINKI